ncbi:hypothetical protein AMELA_G00297710, partial [Ameiurus melas]
MFTIIFMCLWLSLDDSMADPIKSLFPHKEQYEGDNVTLSCSYSGTVRSLHWYRQYPKSKPEFLLYIFPSGVKSDSIPLRLSAEVDDDDNKKQVDLLISSAVVSDSALYYCA